MSRDEVRLRRLESRDELAPALALAREFGDWASERVRVELGIVIPADADPDVLDELLESGGRLYIAEVDGEAVGVGGLKRLGETVGENRADVRTSMDSRTRRRRGDPRAVDRRCA